MKGSILVMISVGLTALLLLPCLVLAETDQLAASNPPVSQPLVREGTIALKLADALQLGTVSSEAEAETKLGNLGVAPSNGWIADYPVTPDIVGELQKGVIDAANSQQLPISKEQAYKAFQDVMTAYSLSVTPGVQTESTEASTSAPDQTIINNYYYDEGPPVVTYYAPPPDYSYLYTWVPYPFWWWDFWFPGFFVLADFDFHGRHHGHRDRDFDRGRDFHHGRDGDHFSNHFRDPRNGTVSRIDPANRAHGGTFTTSRGGAWTTTSARNGAQGIYNQRVSRVGTSFTAPESRGRGGRSSATNWSSNRGSNTVPVGNRTVVSRGWNSQNVSPRSTFNTTRSYSSSRTSSVGRTFTPSYSGGRTYSYRGGDFGGSRSTLQSRGSSSFSGWHSSGGGSMRSSGGSWRR